MTRTAVLAALALLALGCRTSVGPPLRPVLGEEERIEAWLVRASGAAALRTGVRAVGHLRLSGPRGSGRVKQVIIAERPARLRLESLNFLGQTASVLVSDGRDYVIYDGDEFERGAVSEDLLIRYLGLDVAPEEAVALLVAAPELPQGPPDAVLGRGNERVALYATRRVHFAETGELIGVEALEPGGEVRWHATYGRWRDVPGGRYPYAMSFHFPRRQLVAELELDSVELNPQLDDALFSLLPEGSE